MSEQRILLFGSSGQLGGDMLRQLSSRKSCEVKGLSHTECDVRDPQQLESAIESFSPQILINCTAYNFVDAAQKNIQDAFDLNCSAVANMARLSAEKNVYFLHFSTDFVFDGKIRRPYRETDPVSPLNIYGLSKTSGEEAVRLLNPRHCIIRTVGLYGYRADRENYNFIEKILSQTRKGDPIRVRKDTVINPTYSLELAAAACDALENELLGTYHGGSLGECNWYDFTKAILENAGVKHPVEAITGQDLPKATPRPLYTVLDPAKLISEGATPFSSWENALKKYFQSRPA